MVSKHRYITENPFTYVLIGAIIAILAARGYVLIIRTNFSIGGVEMHHVFYGVALLIIGGFIYFYTNQREKRGIARFALFLFGAGCGLVADELNFFTYNSSAYSLIQYYSESNVYSDVFLLLMLFLLFLIGLNIQTKSKR